MATAQVLSTAAASQPSSTLPHEVTIGDAVLSDAAAIALIGADTYTATFGFSVPADDLAAFLAATYSAAVFEAEILNAQQAGTGTFVARDGSSGAVLGFVQLVRGLTDPCIPGDAAAHAELRRLYVSTAAHGRGIGTKLVAAVEARAKAEGFQTLWLTVWEDNTNAQRLYERLGYVKVGKTDFATGGCIQTDHVYAKTGW
ncbi:acyl-CoA N-acyltransferase [Hypoxylon sp. FL1284]|nr:acyl-CoA N-acyltransferase [Hypoxylon sp. FL1284]